MPGVHREGRNRGNYSRHGVPAGVGGLEDCLLAIAEAQAVMGMRDGEFESACGVWRGSLRNLRRGKFTEFGLERITRFLERQLVEEGVPR